MGKNEQGTVGKLLDIAEAREHALIQCNTDKRAIEQATQKRPWYKGG